MRHQQQAQPGAKSAAPTVSHGALDSRTEKSRAGTPQQVAWLRLQREAGNRRASAALLGSRLPIRNAGVGQRQVVQRALSTGGFGLPGLFANKGAEVRERQLSARLGVHIGPHPQRPERHFSHSMLDRIEEVLSALGDEHVRQISALGRIQPAGPDIRGAASAYDELTRSIDMVSPLGLPSWLYTALNRGSGWQRWLMDRAPLLGSDGVSPREALGLSGPKRRVMGGTSKVLAHGNLVSWTVRHEVGHAVDSTVNWHTMMGQAHFAGWRTYGWARRASTRVAAEVAHGLNLGDAARNVLIEVLREAGANGNEPGSAKELRNRFAQVGMRGRELERLLTFIRLAHGQPWTLNDGGGEALSVDGQVFHVDHYGEWVSYLKVERDRYALSNYQFSTPAEWFAEAYAGAMDPRSDGPRQKMNPAALRWFENELPGLLGGRQPMPIAGHPQHG